jgi:Fe-S cluster biogenesis protein NfuA
MSNPDSEFNKRVEKLDGLLRDLEGCDDPVLRGKAIEAVQTLMEFHGAAVARMVERVTEAGEPGRAILAAIGNDELAGSLLLLYGLHPADFDSRVRQALEKAGPALRALGGSAELIGIDDGVVRLRAQWNGHGCQSSPGKIKAALEGALYEKAPELTAIRIDGLETPVGSSGFVPLEQLLGHHRKDSATPGKCAVIAS